MSDYPAIDPRLPRTLLDTLIRFGLIAGLALACYEVFRPFLSLMFWSLILAVTLYPLHQKLKRHVGKDGWAATLLVVIAIAILLVPAYLLGASLTESVQAAIAAVKQEGFHLPTPPGQVANWPLVGKPLYAFWSQAASDLTSVLQQFAPQLKGTALAVLGNMAAAGIGLLVFIGALAVAGIIMAYGEKGHDSARRIAKRVVEQPGRSEQIVVLCTATIRAVAQGVIGIAFIQMLLIGAGFVVKGVPGAGLLALGVLIIGIMQLPASLITLPVIGYVLFSEGATLPAIIFAVYTFVAGMADNVLKPLLLGRGVDVPMPVILIGALGGMVVGGIIGLFIGPVLLAVGYKLFWEWVDAQPVTSQTNVG